MNPSSIIPKFDDFLKRKNLKFEAIAIGGTALALLGVITRETRDCGILSPNIPKEINDASKEFAQFMQSEGFELRVDWLNNGPSSLLSTLPQDWSLRVKKIFEGHSLKLLTLGRSDLLKTKLFALCDRDIDLADCLLLKPSLIELQEAITWVKQQDANSKWPDRVTDSFQNLAKKLGYEF